MDGILPLWKERGMTSHDCVFQLRKILKTKKVGHTGTLDPEVDGVLPICIGPATKVAEFMTDMGKAYQGEITLGYATTTEDAHGDITDRQPVITAPTEAEVDQIMQTFIGTIEQIPPMYSAVKVNGKKLYEYARNGESVERPVRKASIYSFVRTSSLPYDAHNETVSWDFEVHCGKGTYVRTLAVDLGRKLGYPAHMSRLTRTASGHYTKENCATLDQVRELMTAGAIQTVLQPIEAIFTDLPAYQASEAMWDKIKDGAVLDSALFTGVEEEPLIAIYYQNRLVALYKNHPSKIGMKKPRKMFLTSIGQ